MVRKSAHTWGSAQSGFTQAALAASRSARFLARSFTPPASGRAAARCKDEALALSLMMVLDGLSADSAGVRVVFCGGADFAGVQDLRGRTLYKHPLPARSSRSRKPPSHNILIQPCAVRRLMLALAAMVAMLGQHVPSSFAQSAKANSTIFGLVGRSSFQTSAMRVMLMRRPLHNPKPAPTVSGRVRSSAGAYRLRLGSRQSSKRPWPSTLSAQCRRGPDTWCPAA